MDVPNNSLAKVKRFKGTPTIVLELFTKHRLGVISSPSPPSRISQIRNTKYRKENQISLKVKVKRMGNE